GCGEKSRAPLPFWRRQGPTRRQPQVELSAARYPPQAAPNPPELLVATDRVLGSRSDQTQHGGGVLVPETAVGQVEVLIQRVLPLRGNSNAMLRDQFITQCLCRVFVSTNINT